MLPPDSQDPRLQAEVLALLEAFFGPHGDMGAVDWRTALDGEELVLSVCDWGTPDAIIEAVTYSADGVCQVAPPVPFDAFRCAAALNQALHARGEGRDIC